MEFGSAVILAGGKSRRMGFDKQQLQINNRYLVRFHEECLSSLFQQLIVVTNTPDLYQDTRFQVVRDEILEGGPLSGIHIGLKSALSRFVYILACDMPYINIDYVEYMKRRLQGRSYSACVARCRNRIEPFNAFYCRELVEDIESYLETGKKSVFQFLQGLNVLYVSGGEAGHYCPDWRMFVNLNTREEFEEWRRQSQETQLKLQYRE